LRCPALGSGGTRVRGVQPLLRLRTAATLNPGPLSAPESHPHQGDERSRCVPMLGTGKRGLQRDVRPPTRLSSRLCSCPRAAVRVKCSLRFPALMSLDLLTGLRKTVGAYEDARPLYECALRVREKTLGSEDADVAESLAPRGPRPEDPDARPLEERRGQRLALPVCGLRHVALGRGDAGGHTGGTTRQPQLPGWFKRTSRDARKRLKVGEVTLEVNGTSSLARTRQVVTCCGKFSRLATGDAVAGRMDPWIDPTFQYA